MTTQKGVYQVDAGLWIAGDYLAGGGSKELISPDLRRPNGCLN